MLILKPVRWAYLNGKLFTARPIASWDGEPRAFFMCASLHDSVLAGRANEDEEERQRWAKLEAQMGTFVDGGYVNEDFMKQLQPPKYEHWEMKSRRPKPALRVFGRFADPDVFVGTHVLPRVGLGRMWSREYEHEKLVCEDQWEAAGLSEFFSDPPDFRYESYITENASKKVRISK